MTYPGSAHIGNTIEADKHAPLPDQLFVQVNPAKIDAYHEAVARELAKSRH
jgi:hypothetical protein